MRIGYLVPEFPTQTHNFFWNEISALHQLGVETCLMSTRRPCPKLISQSWASTAQAETTYLAEHRPAEICRAIVELFKLGPSAWWRAISAGMNGCPPTQIFYCFAILLAAMRLVILVRSRGLVHVHSHSCGRAALIAMMANRLAGVSYSLSLHGDLIDYGPQQPVKFRYAAFAITITRKLLDQIRHRLNADAPNNIGLSPMGVNTMTFKRSKPYQAWDRRNVLRLFSCGRLNYVKGHQDSILAVHMLSHQGVDAVLEIAGEDDVGGGGYRRNLEELVRALDLTERVSLLGAVSAERVLQGLSDAHLFVLASHHEPLGVAIMEAMSCSVPVIATNLGGVPELIDHGIDGYLVSPKDPSILAGAIEYVATNPDVAVAFSNAARAKIETRFRSDLSAIELKRLIETCICKGSSARKAARDNNSDNHKSAI